MRKNISILVSLLILSHTACSDKGLYFEESGSVFHTSYHIKYKAKQILTDKIDQCAKPYPIRATASCNVLTSP